MDNKAMFKLSCGLFALTANEAGKDNGCIINTAMQVTSTPNRISVTVNKSNYTHDMIMNTGEFTVSVLSEAADFAIFKDFGFQSGRTADKFADFGYVSRGENGIYYITKGTNAYISGKTVGSVDLGTHTMFLADVTVAEVLSDESSVTYDYYHKNIKPKPERKQTQGWKCTICGYVYEGEELPPDFICPLCKHGAADFEKII